MYILKIDTERCKSCMYCVSVCKRDVLALSDHSNAKGYRYIQAARPDNCVGCGQCALMCPDAAIEIYKEA